jgi:cytochrome c biogenesis protein CcmG/thiol:disulfide interchange protein DsbE
MKKYFIAVLLLTVISLSLGLAACQVGAAASVAAVSSKAPDFSLPELGGASFRLSDTKGKVVILDFFATWCPPCRMEVPHFQALYDQYKDKGLVVVGVALDQGGVADVKPFVKQNKVTYPVVIGDQNVAAMYGGIRGIPTTFIIDRQGNIVEKLVGYRDKSEFEKAIQKLL